MDRFALPAIFEVRSEAGLARGLLWPGAALEQWSNICCNEDSTLQGYMALGRSEKSERPIFWRCVRIMRMGNSELIGCDLAWKRDGADWLLLHKRRRAGLRTPKWATAPAGFRSRLLVWPLRNPNPAASASQNEPGKLLRVGNPRPCAALTASHSALLLHRQSCAPHTHL